MAKASNNEFPSVLFTDGTADPSSPSASTVRLYFKNDTPYWINSGGTAVAVNAADLSASNLSDLSDVGTATPTDGQVLTYATATSTWEPAAAAGGGGGGMTLIDSWVHSVDGDSTAITFSSISGSYTDLLLVGVQLVADDSGASSIPTLRVGNSTVDSGSNYAWAWRNSNAASGSSGNDTSITLGAVCAGAGRTGSDTGSFRLTIPRYTGTLQRSITWDGFLDGGTYATFGGGHWTNTASAIDIITLYPDSGSTNGFTDGAVYLYGI